MILTYPTVSTAYTVQRWGNVNYSMYPGGRHMGIDIGGPMVGAPIYAVCDGVVKEVNLVGAHGYGRHVIIQHDGFVTLYAHLHKVFVMAGEELRSGEKIGEMGGDPKDNDPIDGASTGTHLHFEVILPSKPEGDSVKTFAGWTVDPFPYLLKRYSPAPINIGKVLPTDGLRVRSAPNVTAQKLEGLVYKDELPVMELKIVGNDTWARLMSLREEWVAVIHNGRKYMDLLPLPAPTPNQEPVPEVPIEIPVPKNSKARLVISIEDGKASIESYEEMK
jgi:hypothetical protein